MSLIAGSKDMFESSVILQGTKTNLSAMFTVVRFESSVILQGTKTHMVIIVRQCEFESSVILQGTKTAGNG